MIPGMSTDIVKKASKCQGKITVVTVILESRGEIVIVIIETGMIGVRDLILTAAKLELRNCVKSSMMEEVAAILVVLQI